MFINANGVKPIVYNFSIISNIRTPYKETFKSKLYVFDENIHKYGPVIQAFLKKRKITKEQVWPKLRIVENPIQQIQHELTYQRLYPIKYLMQLSQMQTISEKSGNISTSYIISKFSEKDLKPMLDQYVNKVLICGRSPPMHKHQIHQSIRDRAIQLYRIFFFGEQLSDLQSQIEMKYLAFKQSKFFRLMKTKNNLYRCFWTEANQRCLQLYRNWQVRPITQYDDFRPLYKKLEIYKKFDNHVLINQLNNESFWNQLLFKNTEGKVFEKNSRASFDFICQYLLLRTIHWCNSLEFTRLMRIPPDFQIELGLVSLHGWLIIDKLKKIDTIESRLIASKLEFSLRTHINSQIGSLSIKKKADFIKNVVKVYKLNMSVLDYHFNKSPTKNNPYIKIDSLIWSTAFLEKVDRYSPEVLLFSQYFIKNYEMIQNLTYEDFENTSIEFDVYYSDPDYKQKILSVNPPLPKAEYLQQLKSNKPNKKYYYSYEMSDIIMPLYDEKSTVKKSEISQTNFLHRLFRVFKKYQTLDTFDYYNEVQKQEKEMKKETKLGWTSKQQNLEAIKKEFLDIQKIRNEKRKKQ